MFNELLFRECVVAAPPVFADPRGEVRIPFKLEEQHFVIHQVNCSLNRYKGTVRGLHFQKPPFSQGKLLRVIRGSILDVAVDLRYDSPTYGDHVSVTLSRRNETFFVPPGFAHGFCTLEDDTEVEYYVSEKYAPEFEGGVLWNDTSLGIDWPNFTSDDLLSPKDRQWPLLKDLPPIF